MKTTIVKLFQKYCIKPQFVPVYQHLFKLSLRGMGILNAEGSDITGEQWFMQTIKAKNSSMKTIVDVGANVGGYTSELMMYFPRASYYCFEPNPETFGLLQKNHRHHTRVHLYNAAVSNQNGTFRLYDFADNAPLKATQPTATMASPYKEVIEKFHQQPAKMYRMNSITLDRWAKDNHITSIDWLKIDTEGHELQVLQGAANLLRQSQIKRIQFEFNDMHAYSRTFLRDILNVLPQYQIYRLLPHGWYPLPPYRPLTHELFGFQNLVALLNP